MPFSRGGEFLRAVLQFSTLAVLVSCTSNPVLPPRDGFLALGTWGGDNAGVMVSDSATHIHIGCTYGDIAGRVPLDSHGRMSAEGSYVLRAYPIGVGPSLPATFTGQVRSALLTFTVTVDDTVEKRTVVLGPAVVVYKREPQMGVCPICRIPRQRTLGARRPSGQPATIR